MDDRGRILIPRDIRRKIKSKLFIIELRSDGSIVLKPIANEVLELAGKFKGLLKYKSIEELEEKQEEYVRRERGI
jgi:bifunctional DNA-binding transcriptional regulator/antitoxin component of YhaV-PrlF toxin-antitoxin module